MHDDSAVSALRVDDQDFLVRSTIDRCPKVMMVRELFKNALEAAEHEAEGTVALGNRRDHCRCHGISGRAAVVCSS